MSITTNICPDCGNVIPSSAMAGLCPFCLASSVAEELESRSPVAPMVVGPASYAQIGPYRILDRLGEGGYGVVYRAEQERPLRRMVAIKIMKGGAVSEQAVARFEAERQALAMMEHPSIAHVYDVGETEEGLPYFVMELIEGVPITTYCEENALSQDEWLRLFRQVCEAVAHAHRRGIIHRDLKPSNILVTAADGDALPKVIDFGIAKATETLLTERTLVTRDHQLVGTPAYMSPEQAAMAGGDVDTRSDIYSLGVLLYELLTGTTPFRIEELAKLPYDEALRKVRTEDPQRPSSRRRELTRTGEFPELKTPEFRTPVCTDLDWIVMKALEKDPERRYETAGALSRDLARFLEGGVIEARPPTPAYLVGKFVRKHRVPVLAAAAVMVAMVVGTIVSLRMYFRAEEQAARAERNEDRAEEQAKLALESDDRGRVLFSNADFNLASPLLDDHRPALAVAHLARAVRTNPENHAASARLLYTLASENWARPTISIKVRHGPVLFSPDGARVMAVDQHASITGGKPELEIFDARTGEKLRVIKLSGFPATMELAPDGVTLALGYALGGVAVWDLASGTMLWESPRTDNASEAHVVFSPGRTHVLATYRNERTLRVWEVTSGELCFAVQLGDENHSAPGHADFSPNGSRIVFGFGKVLQVYDVETGAPLGGEMAHEDIIQGLAFLPDGARVVSWSRDATARIWDLEAGSAVRVLPHEKLVKTAAVSPDGSRLLTGTGLISGERSSGISRLWDLDSGALIGKPVEHPSDVQAVAFSADGSKAAVGNLVHRLGDGALTILDAWTGELLMAPIFHPRGVNAVTFSPDGTRLAVSSRHTETTIWELRPGVFRPIQIATGSAVWRAVFDQDDRSILTIGYGGSARRWDAASGEALSESAGIGPVAVAAWGGARDSLRDGIQVCRQHDVEYLPSKLPGRFRVGKPQAAASSEDGELLITGGSDGLVRVVSLRDGELLLEPLRHGENVAVTAVAIDREGRLVASGASDGSVKLWEWPGGRLVDTQQLHAGRVHQITFGPDGQSLASASRDGTARLWWIGMDPVLSPPLDNGRWTNWVAFSPNGEILASSGRDNAARLWDARTGKLLTGALRHIDASTYGLYLLWLPDSRRLVTTGSHDNTARLWDAATGVMLAKPMEQPTSALSAALRPDGKALLFGDDHDFQARVWDLASGEPVTPLLKHDERVYSSAFASNGGRIVTGTRAGSAYIWDVPAPSEPLPEWFLVFAEALGGFRFNSAGVLEQVPGEQFEAAHSEVVRRAAAAEGSLGPWMRWLALDPDERTTCPHSEVPVARYVSSLVKRDAPVTLREALHLDPGNPLVMGRLGYRLVTQPDPSIREVCYGGFLVRRAVHLDPDNADLKWMRALVVLQERIRGVGPGK